MEEVLCFIQGTTHDDRASAGQNGDDSNVHSRCLGSHCWHAHILHNTASDYYIQYGSNLRLKTDLFITTHFSLHKHLKSIHY